MRGNEIKENKVTGRSEKFPKYVRYKCVRQMGAEIYRVLLKTSPDKNCNFSEFLLDMLLRYDTIVCI